MVNEGATRGEGTHKVCPYGWTHGRAPEEGTHKVCPYGWTMAAHQRRAHTRCAPTGGLWPRTRGGHTQGVLLRVVNEALEPTRARGHTQGVPLHRVDYGRAPGEGTHKVCPYGWTMAAHQRRAHTRCAPTGGLWPRTRGGHTQGVLLRVVNEGATRGGGHTQGVPLRVDNDSAHRERAPTRGAPTGTIFAGGGHLG